VSFFFDNRPEILFHSKSFSIRLLLSNKDTFEIHLKNDRGGLSTSQRALVLLISHPRGREWGGGSLFNGLNRKRFLDFQKWRKFPRTSNGVGGVSLTFGKL